MKKDKYDVVAARGGLRRIFKFLTEPTRHGRDAATDAAVRGCDKDHILLTTLTFTLTAGTFELSIIARRANY